MKRYLVTGGAGFIGSHITETLLDLGHFVRVLDNFDTGSRENLPHPSRTLEVVKADLEDPTAVSKAMEGIDYVLHQGARGSVPRSVLDPVGTHHANITGTLNVLIAARDAKIKRVVFASSSSVYGETPVLPKEETMLPLPQSPYALSKLAAEYYCRIFSHVYGLETVCLRYFNIYGPRQNPNLQYAAVIPIFIKNMLAGKPCVIYGDGEQTRDFTFVGDCVKANLLACEIPRGAGEVFNVCCGNQVSINGLFAFLKELMGDEIPPVFEPPAPGDIRHSCGQTMRAKSGLEFQATVTLKDGLKETIRWYRDGVLSTKSALS
jgi:nucleoside-diphosphate-sugar epimerase